MWPVLNSSFLSMKRLGVLLLPPGWDARIPWDESANFNAFKKPTELVVQANPYAAINFRQKIATIPHKISPFGNGQRAQLSLLQQTQNE